jgi:hypothetical protein
MSRAFVGNANDEKQVRGAERRERDIEKQQGDDIRFLMRNVESRRFLWRLLEHCRVFQDFSHLDAEKMRTMMGVRSVGLFLLGEITQNAPEEYLEMQAEKYNAEKREN